MRVPALAVVDVSRVRVRPGASRTAVGGRYDGPLGPALVVAVTAPAVDGRATEAALDGHWPRLSACGRRRGRAALRCSAAGTSCSRSSTRRQTSMRARPARPLPRRPDAREPPRIDMALLIGAAVLLVAVLAVRLSTRAGLPSLLVYLLLGMAIGEAGLGIQFENADADPDPRLLRTGRDHRRGWPDHPVVGACGRCSARPRRWPRSACSSASAVVGVAAAPAARPAWQLALLYGAVLSSTDAAAVFSTLRRLRIAPRLAAMLEAESGINDAPGGDPGGRAVELAGGEHSGRGGSRCC